MSGAGQHAIFGGDPALALAAQEWRHLLLDRSGDQHPCVAETDQAAPLGMAGKAGFELEFPHLVGGAAAGAHVSLLISLFGSRPRLEFPWIQTPLVLRRD